MPPRRSYKKSRAGCKTCKRRRVKCDENHPACGPCNKHGVSCDFMTASLSSIAGPALSQGTEFLPWPDTPEMEPGESISQPARAFPSQAQRMMEMQLVHHCTLIASAMMTEKQDAQIRRVWTSEVPQMAFQIGSPGYLADTLLAVSALHLRIKNPNDYLVRVASSYYLSRGLRKLNHEISEINRENSPSIFTASVLVALYILVSRQEQEPGKQYFVPSAWFRALQGTRHIASVGRIWISKSIFEPLLLRDELSSNGWPLSGNAPFMELLKGLEGESLDPECYSVYINAVRYLSWAYTLQLVKEDKDIVRRSVLAFPIAAPAMYISLLDCHDPRTLVITAYFFGLVSGLEGIWWLEGVARREIMGISSLVPENWVWAMKWPLQRIQHDFSCRSIIDSAQPASESGSVKEN